MMMNWMHVEGKSRGPLWQMAQHVLRPCGCRRRGQKGPEWLDKGAKYEVRSVGTGTRPQDMGEPLKRFGW